MVAGDAVNLNASLWTNLHNSSFPCWKDRIEGRSSRILSRIKHLAFLSLFISMWVHERSYLLKFMLTTYTQMNQYCHKHGSSLHMGLLFLPRCKTHSYIVKRNDRFMRTKQMRRFKRKFAEAKRELG